VVYNEIVGQDEILGYYIIFNFFSPTFHSSSTLQQSGMLHTMYFASISDSICQYCAYGINATLPHYSVHTFFGYLLTVFEYYCSLQCIAPYTVYWKCKNLWNQCHWLQIMVFICHWDYTQSSQVSVCNVVWWSGAGTVNEFFLCQDGIVVLDEWYCPFSHVIDNMQVTNSIEAMPVLWIVIL